MKRGAPIIAEYLGGAVNCDAYHMTDPRSDGLGVSSCIHSSLEDAGVSPEEVRCLYKLEACIMLLFFFMSCTPVKAIHYQTPRSYIFHEKTEN